MKRIIFLLLLVPQLLFAEVAKQDAIFVYDDFSKGLNTKLSNFSLPKNQGDIAENLRYSELGSLTKRDELLLYGTADLTEPILGLHRLYLNNGTKVLLANHGDEIEKGNDSTGTFTSIASLGSGDYRFQWLIWNNVAIGTDGYNFPVKYDGSSANSTYIGSCLATDAGNGAGPSGSYHYKVTFYTSTYEVALNVPSNEVTVSDNDINLSMIPIGPDTYGGENVTGRKIYRHKDGQTTYYLLTNGTIANNTATTLTDSDADGELSATEYPSTYNATPPKGKLCLIHKNRLFIANNPTYPSRLFYSDDSNMDYFIPTDYYFNVRPDDGDQITFIKNLLGILTAGKENSIQKLYTDGDTPSTDWEISDPFSNIGCKSMYSAQESPIGIIYLGSDGIYKFTGQYSQLISEAVTPVIDDIAESNFGYCWGQYYRGKYYLSYPSKATGSSTNNRILIFDLLANAYEIDTLSMNCFTTFNSGSDWDVLYSGSSADGGVYAHETQVHEVMHNKHSDFGGTFTSAQYISTTAGGDANSPVIEIARQGTINNMSGIINDLTGTIDRDSLTGSYVSLVMDIGASKYDKIYWNESFVSSGDDITFAIRGALTDSAVEVTSWSSEYSNPSGSDISGLTAYPYVQYRMSMTTSSYGHSPTLYKANNYNVKLTYLKEGSSTETTIPFHWRSGWNDFGAPGYKKSLKKVYCFHEGTSGTLTLKFTCLDYNQGTKKYDEASDTFNIDLSQYPNYYTEYFTNGKLTGEFFRLDISNGIASNDTNGLVIKKIILVYDVEPLV